MIIWKLCLKYVVLLSTFSVFLEIFAQEIEDMVISFIHCHLNLSIQLLNVQLPTAEAQMLPNLNYTKNGTRYITQHRKFRFLIKDLRKQPTQHSWCRSVESQECSLVADINFVYCSIYSEYNIEFGLNYSQTVNTHIK